MFMILNDDWNGGNVDGRMELFGDVLDSVLCYWKEK